METTNPELVGDQFDAWLAAHDAEVAEAALAGVREARLQHPVCDRHNERDPVSCGWKRAVLDIDEALRAGPSHPVAPEIAI